MAITQIQTSYNLQKIIPQKANKALAYELQQQLVSVQHLIADTAEGLILKTQNL